MEHEVKMRSKSERFESKALIYGFCDRFKWDWLQLKCGSSSVPATAGVGGKIERFLQCRQKVLAEPAKVLVKTKDLKSRLARCHLLLSSLFCHLAICPTLEFLKSFDLAAVAESSQRAIAGCRGDKRECKGAP